MTSHQISNFQDIIDAIDRDPALADALRERLLTKELLQLPQLFARLTEEFVQHKAEFVQHKAEFAQLAEEFAQHKAEFQEFVRLTQENNEIMNRRLATLEDAVAELKNAVAELVRITTRLDARVNRIDSRMGNFEGDRYERKVTQRISAILRRQLKWTVSEILHRSADPEPTKLLALTQEAETSNRAAVRDCEDLEQVDFAAKIDAAGDTEPAYLIAEISIRADQSDIARASNRAAILQAITGGETQGIVICADMSDDNRNLAHTRNVPIIIVPE